MAAAHLHLSSAPRAMLGVQALPLAPPDALMLAWLALEGPTPRERVAGLLWPDSPTDVARNALRQRLFRLRKQLGLDIVGGQAVLALAEGVTHDLQDALTLLGGLHCPESPELDAWLARLQAAPPRPDSAGHFQSPRSPPRR